MELALIVRVVLTIFLTVFTVSCVGAVVTALFGWNKANEVYTVAAAISFVGGVGAGALLTIMYLLW